MKNENNTENDVLLYELREQLGITVTVDNGDITRRIINESRNLSWEDTWKSEDSTGYFKVGYYTQSSMYIETCKPKEG